MADPIITLTKGLSYCISVGACLIVFSVDVVALRYNHSSQTYVLEGDDFSMKLNLDMEWTALRSAIKSACQYRRGQAKQPSAHAVTSDWAPAINDSDSIKAAWIPAGYAQTDLTATLTSTIHGTKAKLRLGGETVKVDCIDPSEVTTLQSDHMLALFIQCMLFAFTFSRTID